MAVLEKTVATAVHINVHGYGVENERRILAIQINSRQV